MKTHTPIQVLFLFLTLSAGVARAATTDNDVSNKEPDLLLPKQQVANQSNLQPTANGIIVIDDDELTETETIKNLPLLTDGSGNRAKAGARFPIVLSSELNSKTAQVGDQMQARLKYDLKIGEKHIAANGAQVLGHVDYVQRARTPLACTISTRRWTMTSGCIGIKFDEIINENGDHIPLIAAPARAALFIKNKSEGRVLGINDKGQVAAPYSMQLRYNAVRMGLNAAAAPLGMFSFGAMPVALGVLGAANPSFAFGKPIGKNVRHRRIKGFFWGALSGVPGSFLIEGTTVKGEEVVLKPGDEFLAEIQREFTGEAASAAELIPQARTGVHAELLNSKSKKLRQLRKDR